MEANRAHIANAYRQIGIPSDYIALDQIIPKFISDAYGSVPAALQLAGPDDMMNCVEDIFGHGFEISKVGDGRR